MSNSQKSTGSMRWNHTWFVGETTQNKTQGKEWEPCGTAAISLSLILPLKSITVLSTPGSVNSPGWAALSYTSGEWVMKTSPETGHIEIRAVRAQLATFGCSAVSLRHGKTEAHTEGWEQKDLGCDACRRCFTWKPWTGWTQAHF